MGGILGSSGDTGMGNLFSVFSEDPQDMPGQGLARTDNYRATTASSEYGKLIDDLLAAQPDLLSAEETYGPEFTKARIKNLNLAINGDADTTSIPRLYLQGLRLADPSSAALLDSLTSTATNELALDNQLDPNQTRLIEQSSRASAAARGMGFGPSDAFAETFAKVGAGETLRDKRRANATNIQQLRQLLAQQGMSLATGANWATPSLISNEFAGNLLQNVYSQNQENNRVQAGLETKIGMHQAETWNDWFKTAAGAMI